MKRVEYNVDDALFSLLPRRQNVEWIFKRTLSTYSGGTAPAFTGLPCYALVGTRSSYSVVSDASIYPRRANHCKGKVFLVADQK
jgi:hypothetical protein